MPRLVLLLALSMFLAGSAAHPAEIVTITADWLARAGRDPATAPPAGKEADWILGDHVLRNDRIAAVIADPVPSRHANMTVRNVGGSLIDLTPAAAANDQLSCWYAGDGTAAYRFAGASVEGNGAAEANAAADVAASRPLALVGKRVAFRVESPAKEGTPGLDVSYDLADGDDFVTVTTRFTNPHPQPLPIEFRDAVRADKTFTSLGWVDVIEIHPPHEIFRFPTRRDDPRKPISRIFVWLQMLNLGYRVPGVVNTDAHYAFHGPGWLRNYIRSPTDAPARIVTADVVRACESGRVTMTNGPFLEVTLVAEDDEGERVAGPGDAVADEDGRVTLAVRVRCANWLDVDRVQVFVNGRPDPALDATRRDLPAAFSRGVERFRHDFSLALDRDAHVVVAAIGEGATLGVVMGPEHAADRPVAVTNPIFVDVGGDGFTPNEDLLDLPIPHQPAASQRRHVHGHAHPHPHPRPERHAPAEPQ